MLAGGVNAACAVQGAPPPEVLPDPPPAAPLIELWNAHPARGPSGPLALDDSTIYLGGSDRRVVAISLATGKERWSRRFNGPIVNGILKLGDTLLVSTDPPEGVIHALSIRRIGPTFWKYSSGGLVAPLVLTDGLLLGVSRQGYLLALHPRTGGLAWRTRVGPGTTPPISNGDSTVTLATLDSLFRISTRDGRILRRVNSPGPILSPWIRVPAGLVASTADSSVVGVNPDDLRVIWSVRLDAPTLTSPALIGDTLFAITRIGTLYRILVGMETVAAPVATLGWAVTAPPVVVDNLILIGGSDGMVRAIQPDGAEAWRLALGRPAEIPTILLEDGLLIMGGKGDLHRYRQ